MFFLVTPKKIFMMNKMPGSKYIIIFGKKYNIPLSTTGASPVFYIIYYKIFSNFEPNFCRYFSV